MELKHLAAIVFVLFCYGIVGAMDYKDEMITSCIVKEKSAEYCK